MKIKSPSKTLEIGAGIGGHLDYENITDQNYYALELRTEWAVAIKKRRPLCHTVIGDCQNGIPFPDGYFDRILTIHVLEHLHNLPSALEEIKRVMKKDGQFCVVIPCEGEMFYSMCRAVSTKRMFEKKYKQDFDWLIKSEHLNCVSELLEEIPKHFTVINSAYFPFFFPILQINLCIGLTLKKTEGAPTEKTA
jgi:SAM-dependent methyltransferase